MGNLLSIAFKCKEVAQGLAETPVVVAVRYEQAVAGQVSCKLARVLQRGGAQSAVLLLLQ